MLATATPIIFGPDSLPIGYPADYSIPTLGYDILAWSEHMLAQPDGFFIGDPWQWTEAQSRVILWWYAVDKHTGQFMFRRGQLVLPKGAGKSPFAAGLCCIELLGPSVFNGFDANGEAVGIAHPSPFVQIAAVSEDQTKNTMDLVRPMLTHGNAIDDIPGLDIGITQISIPNGKLVPISSGATSKEGNRATAAIMDEPHLWKSANGGRDLANVIRRNLSKMSGRPFETTNCWNPADESVAQGTYDYFKKMLEKPDIKKNDILRYHPMVQVEDLGNEDAVRDALRYLYKDAPWIDIEEQLSYIYDRDTHPSDARRYYLNEISATADAWLTEPEWAIGSEPLNVISPDDPIVLGFDGSKRRSRGNADSTALIGCRVSDGHLFVLRVWEQPDNVDEWEVPKTEVDAEVASVMNDYNVVGFYADPAKWESYIAKWEALYGEKLLVKASGGHPIEWWMTGGRSGIIVKALSAFYTALLDRRLTHDNSGVLTRHALNARRRLTRSGIQIAKENPDSPKKIDAVVAAVLAYQCRLDAMAQGVLANINNQRSKAIRRR
jgi:phage terminase large subunit-like protein